MNLYACIFQNVEELLADGFDESPGEHIQSPEFKDCDNKNIDHGSQVLPGDTDIDHGLHVISVKPTLASGMQCNVKPKYKIVTSVATQTDLSMVKVVNTLDASVQVDKECTYDKCNIMKDHTYAVRTTFSIACPICDNSEKTSNHQAYDTKCNFGEKVLDNICCVEEGGAEDGLPNACQGYSDDSPSCQLDDDWDFSDEGNLSTDESESEIGNHATTSKYLLFRSSLEQLLKHCSNCGAVITESGDSTVGSMLVVKMTYINGHRTNWNSQPKINKTPIGNLLLAASILFTGNTFTALNNFPCCFGLKFISQPWPTCIL